MKYGSVCSGIEAASVAWHHLGWEAQWFSEIEHFPSEVLKYRFPAVENLGDMTKLTTNETFKASTIDLLVGGTPCQSFSVAGLRRGLADPRGNLMLTFLSLADSKKPRWIVWENVPGVLSSNGGKDFGTFLGALGELGYGFAYRVLDAQHFGVAQRRRRVFVVGYLGDWRVAAAVLFERESLSRDSKPSRKKGQETPTDAEGSVGATGFAGNVESQVAACLQTTCDDYSRADGFNTVIEQIAQPVQAMSFAPSHYLRGFGPPPSENICSTIKALQTDQSPHVAQPFRKVRRAKSETDFETWERDEKANTLNCFDQGDVRSTNVVAQPIAIAENTIGRQPMNGGNGDGFTEDGPMYTLNATGVHGVAQPQYFESHPNDSRVTGPHDVGNTVSARYGTGGGNTPLVSQPIAVDCYNQTINERTSQTIGSSASDVNHYGAVMQPIVAPTLTASNDPSRSPQSSEVTNQVNAVFLSSMAIRRLTPKECERLQGFPDDWTQIPYRNKPADQCPDGPRYKACGNSMAVPVMRWIGERIQLIDTIIN